MKPKRSVNLNISPQNCSNRVELKTSVNGRIELTLFQWKGEKGHLEIKVENGAIERVTVSNVKVSNTKVSNMKASNMKDP